MWESMCVEEDTCVSKEEGRRRTTRGAWKWRRCAVSSDRRVSPKPRSVSLPEAPYPGPPCRVYVYVYMP